MGWSAFESDTLTIFPSPADTNRFGIEVARLVVGRRSPVEVGTVIAAILETDADLTIVRYPADRVEWAFRLTEGVAPMVVFHADTLIYWLLSVGSGRGQPPSPEFRVDPSPEPGPVRELIGRVFADYTNHYAANPLLDRRLVLQGYQEWATTSTLASECLTLAHAGAPIAVATLEAGEDAHEILLAGVDPAWQGRGVYSSLLWAVEQRSIEAGAPSLVISTQAHNTRVQRAWARHGFVPTSVFETAHVLRPGSERGTTRSRL